VGGYLLADMDYVVRQILTLNRIGILISHEDITCSGIGDYNSHTDKFNKIYYEKIKIAFAKITMMLNNV